MSQYSGSLLTGLASPLETLISEESDKQPAGIVGQIHERQVPLQAIDALDRLYGSLYASYRFQRLGDPTATPHAWIGYQQGDIVGVLLFRLDGARVRVITEMVTLGAEVATAFCRDVFDRYPCIHEIDFNAISQLSPGLRFVCQSFAFSENYVLELPTSVLEYEQALGKSTRKTLRGYGNRLLRDHPGFEWHCYLPGSLPRHAQRALVVQLHEFKRRSMAARGKLAQIDVRETAQLLQMAADCGLYGVGTIDGKLCAGSLALRVGDHCTMLLCAADPAFSQYRLGLMACYWSLCDCLRLGVRQCHLLWGRYRYKEQLLAVASSLHRVRVYRSRWQMLCRPISVVGIASRGLLHRWRAWLLEDIPERRHPCARCLLWLARRLSQGSDSNS